MIYKFNKIHLLLFLFIAFFLFYKIGDIPNGFFCDEAQIGNIAHSIFKGGISAYFVPPFFYRHFNYIFGFLPILSTAPFVFFTMSEATVRLATAFYSLLTLFVVYLILKELKQKIIVPILLLSFSPLFFHISRINFTHQPSLLFLTLGFYFYLRGKEGKGLVNLLYSSLSFGLSTYGYAGYVIGTPIFLGSIILSEIFFNKLNLKKYKGILILCALFLVFYSPILSQAKFNPEFSKRLKDKNEGKNLSLFDKLPTIIKNYPKYYSYDYLFSKGETGLPGAFITRHSVNGNGIYLKIYLPILIIGFFNLLFLKDKQKKYFLPFFIFFFLMPLPDLLTTKDNSPPYSFSLFYGLITIPFIATYALKIFDYFPSIIAKKEYKFFKLIFFLVLFFEISSFLNNYYKYPLFSSNYWGWQYGPKEIVKYFIKEKDNYEEFYMTGYFNEPQALLSFYNYDGKCTNCFIGGINENLNLSKKQLFAERTEEMNNIQYKKYSIKKTIFLPNNQPAYYIIEPIP